MCVSTWLDYHPPAPITLLVGVIATGPFALVIHPVGWMVAAEELGTVLDGLCGAIETGKSI